MSLREAKRIDATASSTPGLDSTNALNHQSTAKDYKAAARSPPGASSERPSG